MINEFFQDKYSEVFEDKVFSSTIIKIRVRMVSLVNVNLGSTYDKK